MGRWEMKLSNSSPHLLITRWRSGVLSNPRWKDMCLAPFRESVWGAALERADKSNHLSTGKIQARTKSLPVRDQSFDPLVNITFAKPDRTTNPQNWQWVIANLATSCPFVCQLIHLALADFEHGCEFNNRQDFHDQISTYLNSLVC